MTTIEVTCARADGVVRIGLNRPGKRNALSPDMIAAINAELARVSSDPDVQAVVFESDTGVFSAGGDLACVKHEDVEVRTSYGQQFAAMETAIRQATVPTVAVIDGLCIGGGCSVALACDIRIATPRAAFSIPTLRHGRVYERDTIARLVELMGPGRASYFLLSGRSISGKLAYDLGLVDVLSDSPDDSLDPLLAQLRSADLATVQGTLELLRAAGAGPSSRAGASVTR